MNILAAEKYLRQRLEPLPGDPLYLALSDLLLAVRELIPANVNKVLDYGSGGSPYRSLFKADVYHRADLAGEGLDFQYDSDSCLPIGDGSYDCVLSTQVLEHVEDPTKYLAECYRVLQPRGRLLLTTHGLFEDHACPHDFWRWTTFGLDRIVENAGFEIEARKKITTGPRASLFLAERQFQNLCAKPVGTYARLLARAISIVQRMPRRLHLAADASFDDCRVVDAGIGGHDMYIGVAIRATRS